MPRVSINKLSFFYTGELVPDKPALLFCHGAGGNHQRWHEQVSGLKRVASPLAVDLPGHGASDGEPATSIDSYREFLRDFSSSLGLNNFVLAGHSMGGAIALDYALQYGNSLSGLVLIGSGARLRVAPLLLETCAEGNIPPGLIKFTHGPAASEKLLESAQQEIDAVSPLLYFADFTACNNFDCMDRLAEIELPVLLICGGDDQMTPPRYSRYLKKHLPQAELVEIERAGHMVMQEAPDRVNLAIASFLKKIGSR